MGIMTARSVRERFLSAYLSKTRPPAMLRTSSVSPLFSQASANGGK
jgi:hypothetical protein